jgi:phosphoglycerate dehydrogenase-like enzyme
MLNVLVTMRFDQRQLDRLRAVSPEILVSQADPETADYAKTDVLYAGAPPRDLTRAPALRWVQLHMAGVNALADHPLYTETGISLTTTSGVHAATIAEYAVTMLLALAHRVPRMVEWQGRGGWPPDEQRWPLFVPAEVRGATLGIVGYGSIGRELARIASPPSR